MKLFRTLIFSFFVLFSFSVTGKGYPYHLSVCMIFQDDAPYLKEWIEFHRLVGVEHFYLFNNNSTDFYLEVLKPYMIKGIVELIDWQQSSNNVQEWDKVQIGAYNQGLRLALGKTKWLAVLDSDEFLFPIKYWTITEFLKPFEKLSHIGGVCVNWVMYGTSDVEKIPEKALLIETLVRSNGLGDAHFKSIVRPERVSYMCSPHYCIYKEGICHCTPINSPVIPPFVMIEDIRINHYWSRDKYYLNNVKIPRRIKWGTPGEACKEWASNFNSHYDTSIFRYIDPLKPKVFGKRLSRGLE